MTTRDDWQPMSTAPKDGTPIQARIPDHGSDFVIAWLDGLVDGDGNICGGWHMVEDQEPPECWSEAICWSVNEDGVKSVEPTHWRSLLPANA